MAWQKKEVYVLTAFFKDDSYSSPSEEFFAETREEAEKRQAELMQDKGYEDVLISDEKEEREFWMVKESEREERILDMMIKKAERVCADQSLNRDQKDVRLAGIMTDMEWEFDVPALKDAEWEVKNPEVIKTYRKICDMRAL